MMKLHEGEEIVKMMFALDFKTHLLTRNLRSNRDGLVDGRIEDLQCNATLFFFFIISKTDRATSVICLC